MTGRGAAGRYATRKRRWCSRHRLPRLRHRGWWVLHNCISHPLLGVAPGPKTVWFHDWTSQHLNLRPTLRPSPMPELNAPRAWAWHHVAGHLAIGLVPTAAAFRFHDRTSAAMAEPHWI